MAGFRKIVLIIGNGFDLDIGLKTSYKDFWESEYCPKDYPAPIIHHLNSRWEDNLDSVRWYDLENELLFYAHHSEKEDVITEEEREYLNENGDYELSFKSSYTVPDDTFSRLYEKGIIKVEGFFHSTSVSFREDLNQSAVWRDNKAFKLIKEGLCKYLKSLQPVIQMSNKIAFQVLALLDEEALKDFIVDVYTFNYTKVLLNGRKPDTAKVHYVHGSCDDGKIIIGTRDDKEFSPSYDFLQKSFDPSFNPPAIVADLQDADEIVIFGHSIGENDRQYFKAFFKQQTDYTKKKRKNITIFTRDSVSELQIKRSLQNMTDGNLSTLFSLNNLQIIKTRELEEDKEKLLDFLVKHGKDELATREFIGRCMHSDS